MKYKDGVSPGAGLHPLLAGALDVVDAYWRLAFGRQAVVTSLGDGTHSEGSKHYGEPGDARVRAADLRTRDLDGAQRARARNDLRILLGSVFDVVLETPHLHLEVDFAKIAQVERASR